MKKREKNRRKEKGFTLIEMVVVLTIITILSSIFVPLALQKVEDARIAKANADVSAIAAGLVTFYSDVGRMPACDAVDCNPFDRSNNHLKFLAIGHGTGSLIANYPKENPAGTDTFVASRSTGTTAHWGFLPSQDAGNPARNNFYNHLGQNNPNGDATIAGATIDYPTTGAMAWKGPYMAKLNLDPWGHTYLISVGAMEKDGSKIKVDAKGWILTAGPDGDTNTPVEDSSLVGDDIGFILKTE